MSKQRPHGTPYVRIAILKFKWKKNDLGGKPIVFPQWNDQGNCELSDIMMKGSGPSEKTPTNFLSSQKDTSVPRVVLY